MKQVEPATAAVQQLTEQLSAKDTRPPSSESWQDAYSSIFPAGPGQVQPAPQPQLPVHTQAQQAVEPLQLLLTQKHQQKPPTSAYPSVSQNDTSLTFPFGASTSIGQHQTYPNQPDFPPLSQQLNSNFGFGGTFASPLETGPKTVSTTVSTGPAMTPGELSGRSGHRRDASGSTKSPPMRSRPIPRVAAAYRMATLADPSSHEAPFRPLTYNPDTFRNSEMSRQTSPEPGTQDNGRRTPKSGKNDAIELGIFAEEQARALFALYVFITSISFADLAHTILQFCRRSPLLLPYPSRTDVVRPHTQSIILLVRRHPSNSKPLLRRPWVGRSPVQDSSSSQSTKAWCTSGC